MKVFILFFKVVYFDMQNSNPMSIFIGHDRKTSIIQKTVFIRIIENIRYGGMVSLRQAAMGRSEAPKLLAIGAIAPPKTSLWSGKNYQLHLFLRQEVIID